MSKSEFLVKFLERFAGKLYALSEKVKGDWLFPYTHQVTLMH